MASLCPVWAWDIASFTPAVAKPLIDAFNKKYPEIEVNFLRGAADLPSKGDAEISAGAEGADLFMYAGPMWHLAHEESLVAVDDLPALEKWPKADWSKSPSIPVSSFMRPRSSMTAEQRLAAIDLFEEGLGYRAVSPRLGVSVSAICKLESRFKIWGRAALENKPIKQVYSS